MGMTLVPKGHDIGMIWVWYSHHMDIDTVHILV